MRRTYLRLVLLILAGILALPWGLARTQAKQQKPPVKQEEQDTPYTEEEYDAYEKAGKEADLDKRFAAWDEFIKKYPKSALFEHIDNAALTVLYEEMQKKNYAKALQLGERWIKHHPGDPKLVAFAAECARMSDQDKKFIEYGLKVYAAKPSSEYAYFLMESYRKIGDNPKNLEWTEKCFPYYPENFELRMVYVRKYADEQNYAKSAEYSELALASLRIAKKPDSTNEGMWRDAIKGNKRICYYIIGINHYNNTKLDEAIKTFHECLKVDPKFDRAYFQIGMALWKQSKLENDEAPSYFAAAELLKGEVAQQAKEILERIYKGAHNGNLMGIEKVYNYGKNRLAEKSAAN